MMVDIAIQQNTDHLLRVNFKQTAKGFWYAEFTVRANTQEELKSAVIEANKLVEDYLQEKNKGVQENE